MTLPERYFSEVLAEFIVETDYEDLPQEVIHQAKRCLLDFLGVALAGSRVELAPLMATLLYEMGGRKEVTLIGGGKKLPAFQAALINGISGHTLDMDDGHRFANGHPGVTTLPAALAMAEREDATGMALIEAIVVGYEIFARIASLVNPSHLRRGFHTTGTIGPFGAAAACSKILKLSREATKNALAIAGLQGAGLLEVLERGQMMKPLHPGKAAQAGLLASLLAEKGAEGPSSIFEGEKGFFKAFSDGVPSKEISRAFERPFEIMNTYFKRYAACRHIHSSLDALKEILGRNAIDIHAIERIDVHTYSVAYRLTGQNRDVRREVDAKFSLPLSIGLMCVYGNAGVDEYSMEKIRHPLVQRIAAEVAVIVDQARDDAYPKERSSRVDVITSKGTFRHEVHLPKGDPEDPLSDEELKEKFSHNARKVLEQEKIEKAIEILFGKERFSVRELMGLLS